MTTLLHALQGDLIKEGSFQQTIKGKFRTQLKKRWIVLTEYGVAIYKYKKDKRGSLKGLIRIGNQQNKKQRFYFE
jgi:hypothetical protein